MTIYPKYNEPCQQLYEAVLWTAVKVPVLMYKFFITSNSTCISIPKYKVVAIKCSATHRQLKDDKEVQLHSYYTLYITIETNAKNIEIFSKNVLYFITFL